MKTGNSYRTRPVVSGVLALAVTTLLTTSLVGSFDPAQLEQIENRSTDQKAIAEARRNDTLDRWT